MKAALVALALLTATPAVASVTYLDPNNSFYITICGDCDVIPPGGIALNLDNFRTIPGYDPPLVLVTVNDSYDIIYRPLFINLGTAVPEPATWALLLLGFAFFAIKGIWPGNSHG